MSCDCRIKKKSLKRLLSMSMSMSVSLSLSFSLSLSLGGNLKSPNEMGFPNEIGSLGDFEIT